MVLERVEAMTERIPEGTLGFNLIYIPEPDWMERLVLAMELIEDQMLADEDLVITLRGGAFKAPGRKEWILGHMTAIAVETPPLSLYSGHCLLP